MAYGSVSTRFYVFGTSPVELYGASRGQDDVLQPMSQNLFVNHQDSATPAPAPT